MEREQKAIEQHSTQEPLAVDFVRLPKQMQWAHQFVVWRYMQIEDELKKPPFDPKTGRLASVANPASWGSLEDARRAYETGKFSRIGIVLTQELDIVGTDLDHCLKEGEPTPEAAQIVRELDSYTEASPSGTGIRILLAGKLPGPYRRRGSVWVTHLVTRSRY